MVSNYVCLFCQKNMQMVDSWGIGLCKGCDVTRNARRYKKRVVYKNHPYDLIWDMDDQEFILENTWGDVMFKSSFDINITPQNALKKIPTILVFS